MARGAFNPQIGAYFEPSSKTVWSRELSGWVNARGDLFRRGQPTPYDNLPDEQTKSLAASYAAKIGMLGATPPPPPAQPAQTQPKPAATTQQPAAILQEVSPITQFARQLGAMK